MHRLSIYIARRPGLRGAGLRGGGGGGGVVAGQYMPGAWYETRSYLDIIFSAKHLFYIYFELVSSVLLYVTTGKGAHKTF